MKFLTKITLLFLVLALTACSSDKNSGPPISPLVKFTPSLSVNQLWDTHPGDGTDNNFVNLTPATAGNAIYTASYDGKVYATNEKSGDNIWEAETNKKIASGPAVGNNVVVVTTTDGYALAFNSQTGKKRWQANLGNEAIATPKISHNTVFIKTIDGRLLALNSQTGLKRWDYASQAPSLILRGGSQPEVAGNYVIAGFENGKVVALNIKNGNVAWSKTIFNPQGSTPLQRMVDIVANPVVSNDIVYVVTYQGRLAALNLQSGQLLWQHNMSSYSGMAIGKQWLFVSDAQGYVWAFDKQTGRVAWRQTQLAGRNLSAPAVVDNAVVVGDAEGYLHWMSQSNGNFVARTLANKSGIAAAPIAKNGDLFAVANNGEILAYKS